MIARGDRPAGRMPWAEQGLCRGTDPDEFFVPGAEQHVAKRVCRHCPVKLDCLAEALDHRMEFGVWGGLTERERRVVLARCPDVASWRPVLADLCGGSGRLLPATISVAPSQRRRPDPR